MSAKHDDRRTVQAVETAFAIVETIDEMQEAGVSEVADELSIAKSTTHKHLQTLEKCEYVVREDGRYRLSLQFLKLGKHVLSQVEIAQHAQQPIDQLAEETGEAVWTAIEEHGRAVYVNKALGERAVSSRGGIGSETEMHCGAIGKALLAHLSTDRVDEIIDRHGLPERTPHTITTREELLEELDNIRERGIAFNRGESLRGLRAVGSPVIHDGELKGALAIAGAENRMKGGYFEEELPELVRGTANEIELEIAYS